MNEKNNLQQTQEKAPKTIEGASTASGKPSAWKRLTAKKWVFPAAYMAAAAIILTLMWVYQDSGKTLKQQDISLSQSKGSDTTTGASDAVAATAKSETMSWPVANRSEVVEVMPYFDIKASSDVQQSAIVEYEDTFLPSTGVSLAKKDNTATFDVIAALSGKVTRVEKVPLIGNLVEITHTNGLKTIYESLADVTVQKGAMVKKGDLLAKAGRNELEKDQGMHVHFEVLQDETPINPGQLITN